jgi:hypothetical protein
VQALRPPTASARATEVNARTNPIAATGEERLTRFEAWRQQLPARQNAREVERELYAIAARLRKAEPNSNFTPFPDPEGEDRDDVRLIEWDFTR